jgi:hypothetical protein
MGRIKGTRSKAIRARKRITSSFSSMRAPSRATTSHQLLAVFALPPVASGLDEVSAPLSRQRAVKAWATVVPNLTGFPCGNEWQLLTDITPGALSAMRGTVARTNFAARSARSCAAS